MKELLYQHVYVFSCSTDILCGIIVSMLLEESGVYLKKLINHFFGDRRYSRIMLVNVHSPLRRLQVKSVNNLAKIQLLLANLQPDQGQLGTSHHLSLHEVMDVTHILKLTHKLGKIIGLRVPRKHGIIHHGQGTVAEVKKSSSLGSSILKLNNTVSAILIRSKIDVISLSKLKKGFNSRIHSLLFGGSIQERTMRNKREKAM
jgi:hypothetical protein